MDQCTLVLVTTKIGWVKKDREPVISETLLEVSDGVQIIVVLRYTSLVRLWDLGSKEPNKRRFQKEMKSKVR